MSISSRMPRRRDSATTCQAECLRWSYADKTLHSVAPHYARFRTTQCNGDGARMAIRWPGSRTSARSVRSDARYRQSAEVSSATHGDRTVLLDFRSEQFFSLDDVGHRIWESLGHRASVDELVTELVA